MLFQRTTARPPKALPVGAEVLVQGEYRALYGVLLRVDPRQPRYEVCLWDAALEEWRVCWMPVERVSVYEEATGERIAG